MAAPASTQASKSTTTQFEVETRTRIRKMLIARVGYSPEALDTVELALEKEFPNEEPDRKKKIIAKWLEFALQSADPLLFVMYSGASPAMVCSILKMNPSEEAIKTVWNYIPYTMERALRIDYAKTLLNVDVAKEMVAKCPNAYRAHIRMLEQLQEYTGIENQLLCTLKARFPNWGSFMDS